MLSDNHSQMLTSTEKLNTEMTHEKKSLLQEQAPLIETFASRISHWIGNFLMLSLNAMTKTDKYMICKFTEKKYKTLIFSCPNPLQVSDVIINLSSCKTSHLKELHYYQLG